MRNFLTIILAAFTGILIGLPVVFSLNPLVGIPAAGFFAFAGVRIGIKRQASDAFFYFTLICSLILISLLLYASFNAKQTQTETETDRQVIHRLALPFTNDFFGIS